MKLVSVISTSFPFNALTNARKVERGTEDCFDGCLNQGIDGPVYISVRTAEVEQTMDTAKNAGRYDIRFCTIAGNSIAMTQFVLWKDTE
jgi:hypothetical protein